MFPGMRHNLGTWDHTVCVSIKACGACQRSLSAYKCWDNCGTYRHLIAAPFQKWCTDIQGDYYLFHNCIRWADRWQSLTHVTYHCLWPNWLWAVCAVWSVAPACDGFLFEMHTQLSAGGIINHSITSHIIEHIHLISSLWFGMVIKLHLSVMLEVCQLILSKF